MGSSEKCCLIQRRWQLVSQLVGALSPRQAQRILSGLSTNFSLDRNYSIYKSLNHKRLVLLSINSVKIFLKENHFNTTYLIFYRTRQSLSEGQNQTHSFEMLTWKLNYTCSGAYLHSAGTQRGNLHQSSRTTRRMTYFILRVHAEVGASYSYHRRKLGRGFNKMQANGPGR